MNLSFLPFAPGSADSAGKTLIRRHAGPGFRTACRAGLRWALPALLLLGGTLSPLCAAEYPPESADPATANQSLEFKIKPSAEGMVLTWFGEVGVPFQVQASTDLNNWTDVGPIIGGTNGLISITISTTELQSALRTA